MLRNAVASQVHHLQVLVVAEGVRKILSKLVTQLVSHKNELPQPRMVCNALLAPVHQMGLLLTNRQRRLLLVIVKIVYHTFDLVSAYDFSRCVHDRLLGVGVNHAEDVGLVYVLNPFLDRVLSC